MYALQEPSPYNPQETAKLTKRRIEAARMLLLRGNIGDVNAQNEDGETLLMRAVNLGEPELEKRRWTVALTQIAATCLAQLQ